MSDRTEAGYHAQERDYLVHAEDFRTETAAAAHRSDFPGSDQRDGNDHSGDRRFTSWLKEIDPDAADAYTHRHDLTQYPPEKREAVLAAHVEAFNMSHSPNGQDRLQGATDLSLNHLRPHGRPRGGHGSPGTEQLASLHPGAGTSPGDVRQHPLRQPAGHDLRRHAQQANRRRKRLQPGRTGRPRPGGVQDHQEPARRGPSRT